MLLQSANLLVSQSVPVVAGPANGSGYYLYISNDQILASFDAGDSPTVDATITCGITTASASILGYMISCP